MIKSGVGLCITLYQLRKPNFKPGFPISLLGIEIIEIMDRSRIPVALQTLCALAQAVFSQASGVASVCPSGITWSGIITSSSRPSTECKLVRPLDLVSQFNLQRVHVAGDFTLRMPLQFFEHAWLGCPTNAKELPKFISKLKQKADAVFCSDIIKDTAQTVLTVSHPLNSFALTYEPWLYIEGACFCQAYKLKDAMVLCATKP